MKRVFFVEKENLENIKRIYGITDKDDVKIIERKPEAEAKEEKSEPKKESLIKKVKKKLRKK